MAREGDLHVRPRAADDARRLCLSASRFGPLATKEVAVIACVRMCEGCATHT